MNEVYWLSVLGNVSELVFFICILSIFIVIASGCIALVHSLKKMRRRKNLLYF